MIPNYPVWSEEKKYSLKDKPRFRGNVSSLPILSAITIGPEERDVASEKLNLRYWAISVESEQVWLRRAADNEIDWEAKEVLGGFTHNATKIAACMDKQGVPVIFYESAGEIFHWDHKNAGTVTNLGPGTNPIAAIDFPVKSSHTLSDVMITYQRENGIFYRLDSDNYVSESTVTLPPGAEYVKLKGVEYRTDNRLEVSYTYAQGEIPPPLPPAGPIRYWAMNETPTPEDGGGTQLTGGTIVEGRFGNALQSNATSKVACSEFYLDDPTAPFSISTWVYVEANGGLMFFAGGSSILYLNNFSVRGFGAVVYSISNAPVPAYQLDKWTHFCITKEGTDIHVYIDGKDHHFPDISGTLPSGSWQHAVGTTGDSIRVDNTRVYDRVLTAEEVHNLLTEGTS